MYCRFTEYCVTRYVLHVDKNSNDLNLKNRRVQYTTAPFKPLFDKNGGDCFIFKKY